ncbi:MAG: YbgF trimerization domain-containing protein, partial [Pseudohongiella sp.]
MKRFLAVFAGGVTAVVFNTTAFAQAGSSNNEALMLLLDQFQDLRSEMQTMRGMVEEHGYEIRRLQQDSLDRYTDLDARISALYEDLGAVRAGNNAGTTPPAATTGVSAAGSAVTPAPLPSTSPGNSMPVAAAASTPQAAQAIGSSATLSANTGSSTTGSAATGMLTEQQLYELALDSLLQQEEYQRSV